MLVVALLAVTLLAEALLAEALMLAVTLPMLTFTETAFCFSVSFSSGDGESLLPEVTRLAEHKAQPRGDLHT